MSRCHVGGGSSSTYVTVDEVTVLVKADGDQRTTVDHALMFHTSTVRDQLVVATSTR